jgi:hypothetical protein
MADQGSTAFGIYTSRAAAEFAVQALQAGGYRSPDVSILYPTLTGSSAVAGGTLGWLSGIGVLTIPGMGQFVAAGPIVTALAGSGVLVGALIAMGTSEPEALRYEEWVRDGGILLSVHCTNAAWTRGAQVILERTGARDVAAVEDSNSDRKAS